MTVLPIALFCSAGLIAVGSMVATVKHNAASVLALLRDNSVSTPGYGNRWHLGYARRLKPQPGWRARARVRSAGRDLHRDGKIPAKQGLAARKYVQSWHYRFRLALLPDTFAIE